jgi:GH24 family phage-related lysozyme (muramidase)
MNISKAAYDLILKEEVSSPRIYEKKYRGPIWPGHASGVTIGIGYDVGYVTATELRREWQGRIPDPMIAALIPCCGVTGKAAQALVSQLRRAGSIDIPFEVAKQQFDEVKLPKFERLTARALPNTDQLHPDCFGALVSLTFNRGTSYSVPTSRDPHGRYREMRAIRVAMAAENFHLIPACFRDMKRLWPRSGIAARRENEAKLFERGLKAQVAPLLSAPPELELETPGGVPAKVTTETIAHVQSRLRALGYYEVGEIDGGENGLAKTRATILAFRNDNGLPITPDIDDELLVALATATPRPVAASRANATAKDLAPKVEAVEAAGKSKLAAMWLAATSFVGGLIKGVFEHLETAKAYVAPVQDFLGDIPSEYYLVGVSLLAFFIWRSAQRAEQSTVQGYNEGRIL